MALEIPDEEISFHWYERVTGAGFQVPGCAVTTKPGFGTPETVGIGASNIDEKGTIDAEGAEAGLVPAVLVAVTEKV